MRTIMVMKGLPGSGKSSLAKDLQKKEPKRWKRVNRDDLRGMLDDGEYDPVSEDFVTKVQETLVRNAMAQGFDVIVDNTHLVAHGLKKLHRLAESVGDVKVIERGVNVPLEECIKRNALRQGRAQVPEQRIREMASKAGIDKGHKLEDREAYYPPKTVGTYVHDESLPPCIMCDLDGTLAIIGDRTPYDATDCDLKDKPNWPVIKTVMAMHAQGYNVIFMSGRDSKYRPETQRFIEKYCLAEYADKSGHYVIPFQLHMRPEGDLRKDSIIKSELFEAHVANKYDVLYVLDDRDQVVDFWRSIGLDCHQVNYGNF